MDYEYKTLLLILFIPVICSILIGTIWKVITNVLKLYVDIFNYNCKLAEKYLIYMNACLLRTIQQPQKSKGCYSYIEIYSSLIEDCASYSKYVSLIKLVFHYIVYNDKMSEIIMSKRHKKYLPIFNKTTEGFSKEISYVSENPIEFNNIIQDYQKNLEKQLGDLMECVKN